MSHESNDASSDFFAYIKTPKPGKNIYSCAKWIRLSVALTDYPTGHSARIKNPTSLQG